MIGKLSMVRHGIVGAAIGGTTLLAGLGVIANPHAGQEERFDAKTLVVSPAGERGVRITEYVDIDFGSAQRRGYLRLIPNDLGVPTDIVAASPDAADDLTVIPQGDETEIRIGDPDRTWRGQHRYELAYTLPDAYEPQPATASPPVLALDIVAPIGIGEGDAETGRFEVIVNGFELSDTRCDVGRGADEGGCELTEAADGTHRVVLEPLPANDGLTIGGVIDAVTEPVTIDPPPIPDRRSEPDRGLVALGVAALGLAGAIPVHRWARRRGRNEVFAGGAADAAYGSLPPPGSDSTTAPVALVPDDEMGDLATIEFVPPKGITPWEASVLMRERVDDETVEAWLSGLVGREALTIEEAGKDLELSSGPRRRPPRPDPRSRRPVHDREVRLAVRVGVDRDPALPGRADRRERLVEAPPAGDRARHPHERLPVRVDHDRGVRTRLGGLGHHGVARCVRWLVVGDRDRAAVPGDRGLLRLPGAAAVPERPGLGARAPDRVVPAIPPRERGAPRRVGVDERVAA